MTQTDRRDRAGRFRRRLARALREANQTQSGLARAVGADRSTISQLLSGDAPRLPNAHIAAECAAALQVSTDWLLGLSDRPERAADLLAASMKMSSAARALVDDQLIAWHREAQGYKIRHVPARLPDMLKTTDMLRWEYTPFLGRTTDQAIGLSDDSLSLLRNAPSDYEIAIPLFEIDSMVRCEGYYSSLTPEIRDGQVARLIELYDQLYPTLRIFLYDARRLYSSPVTVFGPLLAVLYLGQQYIVFRDTERVTALTRHFDFLVREATIADRDLPDHLDRLMASAPG
ncbi:MAG: helix-turn-helix domain-containing protein [Pseudomonadota bacterium]